MQNAMTIHRRKRLKTAAIDLRKLAARAEPETGWSFSDGGTRDDSTQPADSGLIMYIQTMSPALAVELADWMDDAAEGQEVSHFAMNIVNMILGEGND